MSKTNAPVRRLVLLLEEARKEFNLISNKFDRSNDFALANEEIDLWEDRTCEELTDLGASDAATKLRNVKWTTIGGEQEENTERRIDAKETVLVSLLNDILKHPEFWIKRIQSNSLDRANSNGHAADGALSLVTIIGSRLHLVALQLQDRHEGRTSLKIHDEYDVQDLLHSLLRLHFDDIRPEEWSPSYVGGSARMDFLLKAEQIVIEAKMTRPGRDAKKISDELIVDAARYKGHPDCKTLLCLVYDPEKLIRNPRGVESDLRKMSDSRLHVVAIIAP